MAATPPASELSDLVKAVDSSIELVIDHELLRPEHYAGDNPTDPRYTRTAEQQQAYEDLLISADVIFGVPDQSPRLLGHVVRTNPRLRWVHTMPAGGGAQVRAAGLSADELTRVTFTTSAGVHGGPLAEFSLFGLLAGAKDLTRLQELQSQHVWAPHWAMRQLREQTVLILGLGGIGMETARLVSALGARVIGIKRRPEPVPYVDSVHGIEELPRLVAQADGIVITLPGTPYTEKLVDADLIAAMKPGTVIINVGRGTVIDEPALIDALRSGHIRSACLDVAATEPLPADSPLWMMPQVLISPHTAAEDPGKPRRIATLFAANLESFVRGEPMRNVVDTKHFY
ncbi:D-2-hydroxyacid dehydrogenase [Saccharopolyspora sp. K220]|uniref:D-2-hydroxyacid dehydrogenase n=1 Tax=Saccharopolyspora soli TaxID=2926618 RepID=UPI001F58BB14|nr:D-2-hydroxyacid dehydrogenase [Saccharopolyspora soli]MCI2422624.1 D-2-hydroxyacid dehydrogenase [Saccharopolyspora soli]